MFNSKFDKLFQLIIENSHNFSIHSLFDGIKIQQKSNNNFPEGHDINITNELLNYYLNEEISQVILTKHCIKCKKDNNEIHGVNYINITKEQFLKAVVKCVNTAYEYLLSRKIKINIHYESFRIECKFIDITTNLSFKLAFQSVAVNSYQIKINLITIYPFTYSYNTDQRTLNNNNLKSYIIPTVLVENKLINTIQVFDILINHL